MDNDCRKSKNVWKSACNYEYIFANAVMLYDGAVGLISIHLAFYQMNPWPTALAAFSIFGTHTSSTPVGIFCFCRFCAHVQQIPVDNHIWFTENDGEKNCCILAFTHSMF